MSVHGFIECVRGSQVSARAGKCVYGSVLVWESACMGETVRARPLHACSALSGAREFFEDRKLRFNQFFFLARAATAADNADA